MKRRAFSLIELVAVLLALAVIGALAYRRYEAFDQQARFTATLERFNAFSKAVALYHREHGEYPPDAEPGVLPPELAAYISESDWTAPVALGGTWDWNGGPLWPPGEENIAIHRDGPVPRATWRAFDTFADDGLTYEGLYRIAGEALLRPMERRGPGKESGPTRTATAPNP